ncbi:MAG: ribose 5-phosphate isomerase B [SAR202 cluster bacterium]|nr:ribose 5-phosphate isomerase B [SAR202 cluster bacterium]|tara:strand:+ start:9471 stop:9917 length:447 start_codon:yes stop_codon:yes gene_type:complete
MIVVIGADHGGFPLKDDLSKLISDLSHEVLDIGAHVIDPLDDYPDYAKSVAETVASGKAHKGIMLCGSGVGAAITANKIKNVRASVCHDTYSAHQGVEHDDMNVLCVGSRVIGIELAREIVITFIKANFVPEEKYIRRLNKIKKLEDL